MIYPLRQRHRRMFVVLAVILPIALVAGITARRVVPVTASLPSGIIGEPDHVTAREWSRDDLFTKTAIRVTLVRTGESDSFGVELSAPKNFTKPDLLVYWVIGNASVSDNIPDSAILLGGFNGSTPLHLPNNVSQSAGILILYSLADQEIVDISKPFVAAEVTRRAEMKNASTRFRLLASAATAK